jgi:hypothetical protein
MNGTRRTLLASIAISPLAGLATAAQQGATFNAVPDCCIPEAVIRKLRPAVPAKVDLSNVNSVREAVAHESQAIIVSPILEPLIADFGIVQVARELVGHPEFGFEALELLATRASPSLAMDLFWDLWVTRGDRDAMESVTLSIWLDAWLVRHPDKATADQVAESLMGRLLTLNGCMPLSFFTLLPSLCSRAGIGASLMSQFIKASTDAAPRRMRLTTEALLSSVLLERASLLPPSDVAVLRRTVSGYSSLRGLPRLVYALYGIATSPTAANEVETALRGAEMPESPPSLVDAYLLKLVRDRLAALS